jgi:micrococcal nuclease
VRPTTSCTIEKVVDGDTFWCRGGPKVRLLLIDAPEADQGPFGNQARDQLLELLPVGSTVQLEPDVQRYDRYGRNLAYVYLPDGRMANQEMARAGYAVALSYPPNMQHIERIRAAVTEARQMRRGLWATSAFECTPRDHRRHRC